MPEKELSKLGYQQPVSAPVLEHEPEFLSEARCYWSFVQRHSKRQPSWSEELSLASH